MQNTQYRKSKKRNTTARAVGIVIHNKHILLMWRKKGKREFYVFPGGGVEQNETVQEAVIRELREETTLEVKIDRLLYHHHYIENNRRYTDQYYYLCTYISGEPQLDPNSEEYEAMHVTKTHMFNPQWVKISDLPHALVFPLEVKDWLIHDIMHGFSNKTRHARIHVKDLRQEI